MSSVADWVAIRACASSRMAESPVEPAQERADASDAPAGPEVLATGDGAGVLGEPLDPQQLALDRAGEKVRSGAMARERAEQCSPGHSGGSPQPPPSWEPRGRWSVGAFIGGSQ